MLDMINKKRESIEGDSTLVIYKMYVEKCRSTSYLFFCADTFYAFYFLLGRPTNNGTIITII